MSLVAVKDTTIYYRGLPNPYGINDHRMGTVDRRLLCGTCGRDVKECQGHVGHIELAFPMYHIGFMDACFKTLRCVCFACSRCLLTDDELAHYSAHDEGKGRFQSVYNAVKTRKRCHHCGMPQPTYTRLSLSIKCDWQPDLEWESKDEEAFCTRAFTQREALSILTHIPEADASAMGFNSFCKPRDMILCSVLVPPPVARPAIMASEGSLLAPPDFPPLARRRRPSHPLPPFLHLPPPHPASLTTRFAVARPRRSDAQVARHQQAIHRVTKQLP